MHKVGAQDTDGPSLAADAPNTADVAPNALVADLLPGTDCSWGVLGSCGNEWNMCLIGS
jgi:hypothetical protein